MGVQTVKVKASFCWTEQQGSRLKTTHPFYQKGKVRQWAADLHPHLQSSDLDAIR